MPGVTREQIDKAKELDLLTYLQTYDPQELKPNGPHEYCTKAHDSLIISNGKWMWNSQRIGGKSALDYLIKVQGIPFVEAVRTLCNERPAPKGYRPPQREAQPVKKSLVLPKAHSNNNTVSAYLQKRGIDPAIIAHCIHAGILYESAKYHSCVFVGKDETGTPKYAAVRGTIGDYKQEAPGSDKRHGFCIPAGNETHTVAVCESPIDALSHATIYKRAKGDRWRNVYRLSLGGVAPLALWTFLKQHPEIKTVKLCLDNDKAGREAATAIKQDLSQRRPDLNVEICTPHPCKDLNDYLLNQPRSRPKKAAIDIYR